MPKVNAYNDEDNAILRELATLALAISNSAPKRSGESGRRAYVPWALIIEIRAVEARLNARLLPVTEK